MGRSYAGVLGSLAFCTVVVRGAIKGGSVEATLKTACLCLFAFALIGLVVGKLAAWIVEESVMGRFKSDLQAYREKHGDSSPHLDNDT